MNWITAGLVIGLVASFIGALRQRRLTKLREALAWRTYSDRSVMIGVKPGSTLPAGTDLIVECSGAPTGAIAQRFDSPELGKSRPYDCEAQPVKITRAYLRLSSSLEDPAVILLFVQGPCFTGNAIVNVTLGARPAGLKVELPEDEVAIGATVEERDAIAVQITPSTKRPRIADNDPWHAPLGLSDEHEWKEVADNSDAVLFSQLEN